MGPAHDRDEETMLKDEAEWRRVSRMWAAQEAQVLLDEMGINIARDMATFLGSGTLETICLTPQRCEPGDHDELTVVAVLAGEWNEEVGWLDVKA